MSNKEKIDQAFIEMFDETKKLRDRNMFVFLHFNELLQNPTPDTFEYVNEFLLRFFEVDAHPSLMKSALIINSCVENKQVRETCDKLEDLLIEKLK